MAVRGPADDVITLARILFLLLIVGVLTVPVHALNNESLSINRVNHFFVKKTVSGSLTPSATNVTVNVTDIDKTTVDCVESVDNLATYHTAFLLNTTVLQLVNESVVNQGGVNITCSVSEFYSGINVLRGKVNVSQGTLSTNVTLPYSIPVNQSYLVFTFTTTEAVAGGADLGRWMFLGNITNSTELLFARNDTTRSSNISWEVRTFWDNSTVQSIAFNFSGFGNTTTIALPIVIPTNQSYVAGLSWNMTGIGPNAGLIVTAVRANLTSENVTFIRFNNFAAAHRVDGIAFVVTLNNANASVVRYELNKTGTQLTTTQTITAINVSRSVLFPTWGCSSAAPFRCTHTMNFTNSTEVRGNSPRVTNGDWLETYYTVEWPYSDPPSAAGGTTYVVAADDVLSSSDLQQRLLSGTRAADDVVISVDLQGRQAALGRIASDVSALVEAGARHLSAGRGVSETFTFADSLGRTLSGTRVGEDVLVVRDEAGRTGTLLRMRADMFAFADQNGVLVVKLREQSDVLVLSDGSSRRAELLRSLEETAILSDLGQRTASFGRTLADILVMLDFTGAGNETAVPGAGPEAPSPQPSGGFVLPSTRPPPIVVTGQLLARIRLSPELLSAVTILVIIAALVVWRGYARRKKIEQALWRAGIDV